jgi:hypothetical protein
MLSERAEGLAPSARAVSSNVALGTQHDGAALGLEASAVSCLPPTLFRMHPRDRVGDTLTQHDLHRLKPLWCLRPIRVERQGHRTLAVKNDIIGIGRHWIVQRIDPITHGAFVAGAVRNAVTGSAPIHPAVNEER